MTRVFLFLSQFFLELNVYNGFPLLPNPTTGTVSIPSVPSAECGMRNADCEARSAKCEVRTRIATKLPRSEKTGLFLDFRESNFAKMAGNAQKFRSTVQKNWSFSVLKLDPRPIRNAEVKNRTKTGLSGPAYAKATVHRLVRFSISHAPQTQVQKDAGTGFSGLRIIIC